MSWPTFCQVLVIWSLVSITAVGGPAVLIVLLDWARGRGQEPIRVADWDAPKHPSGPTPTAILTVVKNEPGA